MQHTLVWLVNPPTARLLPHAVTSPSQAIASRRRLNYARVISSGGTIRAGPTAHRLSSLGGAIIQSLPTLRPLLSQHHEREEFLDCVTDVGPGSRNVPWTIRSPITLCALWVEAEDWRVVFERRRFRRSGGVWTKERMQDGAVGVRDCELGG